MNDMGAVLSLTTNHPSKEGRTSPVTHRLYFIPPLLEDFHGVVYNCWGEMPGYSPPALGFKGLISSGEGKSPPSPPCFPQFGEEHLCPGPWNCGEPPNPPAVGPRPSYLDLRVVCTSLEAESLLVCLIVDKILQSKMSLLLRHQTYGASEAVICRRMKNSLSRQGS